MSFFEWNPQQGRSITSPYIWLYFVVTAGFTCATLSIWYFYSKRTYKKHGNDLEMQSTRSGTSFFEKGVSLSSR